MDERGRLMQVRTAYERGRWMDAAGSAPWGLLTGALLAVAGGAAWMAAGLAIALGVVLVAAQGARSAAGAGARLGLAAVAVPILTGLYMDLWGGHASAAQCAQVCATLSFAGGAFLGFLGGLRAAREAEAPLFAVGFLATAALAGFGGCEATGLGSFLGLSVGAIGAMVPGYAVGRGLARI